MPRILFVCGTNRSRSPLAAAVFKKFAEDAGVQDLSVESAGLRANPRHMICEEVSKVLALEGLTPIQLGIQQVLPKNIKSADLVLCFTSDQQQELESSFLSARRKTRTLMSIIKSDQEIFDPCKGGLIKFQQCLAMMRPALQALAERLT
ncbi:MAG: low molecular weight phosphatase family protein [Lentisphaeria bacterium]